MSSPINSALDALMTQWGIHQTSETNDMEEALKEALSSTLTQEQIGQLTLSLRWDQVTIEAPAETYPLLAWQKDQLRAIAETQSRGTIVHMRLRRRTHE